MCLRLYVPVSAVHSLPYNVFLLRRRLRRCRSFSLHVHRFAFRFFRWMSYIWFARAEQHPKRMQCENIWASYGTSNCLFAWHRSLGCHAIAAIATAIAAAAAAVLCIVCLAGDCITCCYRFVFILAARTQNRTLFRLRRRQSGANDGKYKSARTHT